ncbi:DUF262 domain-containing protein [Bacillus luti]|uniref:DUF262 domain-containing protein n=1 Tax=Bacillus luti TaxID=2026191 RepID=UPI001AD716E5|nr:DUF262 domain-containing protein [Bacillus luti]
MGNKEKLLEELSKERQTIKTDSYNMSIGEIINLYDEGDLILTPAFQRLFRWDDQKKTKFIESILVGIPIPEIFVAQKKDGKWDVVDGVQRISTILQLVGKLAGYPPLTLTETTHLPSLEDFTWESLPMDIKRIFRRGKMGINIILTEESIQAQYELFQRLNTGGLHLSDQEIRNCLLIMINSSFYEKVNKLKSYDNFLRTIPISAERLKEEYHMELILRYFIAKMDKVDYEKYNPSKDILSDFIDKEITRILSDEEFDIEIEVQIFKEVFDLLKRVLGENAFKKYSTEKRKFEGAMSIASFEAIATGVAQNIEKVKAMTDEEIKNKIIVLYTQEEYIKYSSRGIKAINRFKGLTGFSKEYFSR